MAQKRVSVALEKETTIVNVFYRDNDRKLILPVLNKISLAYQDYSER